MRNITKDSKHTPKFGLLIQTGFQNLELECKLDSKILTMIVLVGFQNLEQECKLESKIWTMIILAGFQNLEHLC